MARPSTATGDQFVDKSLKEVQGCLGKVRGRSWEPQALQGSGLASEGALVTGAIVSETSEPLSIPEVIRVTDTRPTVPLPTVVSLCKVFPESWGSEILFIFPCSCIYVCGMQVPVYIRVHACRGSRFHVLFCLIHRGRV